MLGLGNVGGALARRLGEDAETVAAAAGREISLEAVAVRRSRGRHLQAQLLSCDQIVSSRELDAVVEVMGGLEPARIYIETALRGGRQVITANKQVVAAHGPDLASLGPLRFEASVASAIPVIETLVETLAADEIEAITGILNGTTNFMLDAMREGASYAVALEGAQAGGMAEAEPSADVDGHDATAKLAILCMLAFRARVNPADIERVGIRQIEPRHLADAQRQGKQIKLIASAARASEQGVLYADVRPRALSADSLLAGIDGALNAVEVESRYAGRLLFAGLGAGPDAAASAVLSDLIRAARGLPASAGERLATLGEQHVIVKPFSDQLPYPAVSFLEP